MKPFVVSLVGALVLMIVTGSYAAAEGCHSSAVPGESGGDGGSSGDVTLTCALQSARLPAK